MTTTELPDTDADLDEQRIVEEALAALRGNPYVRIGGQNWALRAVIRDTVRRAIRHGQAAPGLPLLEGPSCPVMVLEH
ncbi:hypothetical protein [Zavarzinia sp. CC-PAN008]|uniref:hypothetical protein n=1 Tax=Zavarzinia sp. CC-PAN008 TaxID=3243332 RepID=UPI003F7482B7